MDDKDLFRDFARQLKTAKLIYAECPSCGNLFSLHSARLVYGKEPPKTVLSKAEKNVRVAEEALAATEEESSEMEIEYEHRLDLVNLKSKDQVSRLDEQIRHMKHDVAAVQKEVIKEKVKRALLSQRSVIEGHVAELFPAFGKIGVNPADLCALVPTRPIDFVVFDGLFQRDCVQRIILLDVKKGSAGLTPLQRTIRDCIDQGKVYFRQETVDFGDIKGTVKEKRTLKELTGQTRLGVS